MKVPQSYCKDYPRPQMVRKQWVNLNGAWDFAFDDGQAGERERWFETFPRQTSIEVPFTYETPRSGIHDETAHPVVWYSRRFDADAEKLASGCLLLHFEGCDHIAKVWVNGNLAGSHQGGYARFSLDITSWTHPGENTLTVMAEDSLDEGLARGKQRWTGENFGCWYVQTTGIWKTVWMEYVPACHLKAVKLTPVLAAQALEVECEVAAPAYGSGLTLEAAASFDGRPVGHVAVPVKGARVSARLDVSSIQADEWGVRAWSPEHPDLYDLTLRLTRDGEICDETLSYFGMRDIRIEKGQVLLNGTPLYQRLILDQGYWPETHLTPPSEEALVEDIDKVMQLGYNGVRKHQKTEDERFLFWCDVKGLLVWSEMAAAYRFDDEAVEQFTREWMEIVRQNYSHPSIITWTPFNESWGIPQVKGDRAQQHFTEAVYHLTKSMDASRPVIVNDGWEHTVSDIITLHDYEASGRVLLERYQRREDILGGEVCHNGSRFPFADGYGYRGQPVIISEFGGIALEGEGSGWGYGEKVASQEEFLRRFDGITTAIKELPYVCGYCYTQVTDVQQEVNGLMDMQRRFKVDPEKIRAVNERPCREG